MSKTTKNSSVHELLADILVQKMVKESERRSEKRKHKKSKKNRDGDSYSSDESSEHRHKHSKSKYYHRSSSRDSYSSSESKHEHKKEYKCRQNKKRKHKDDKRQASSTLKHKKKHKRSKSPVDLKKHCKMKRRHTSSSSISSDNRDVDVRKNNHSKDKSSNDIDIVKTQSQESPDTTSLRFKDTEGRLYDSIILTEMPIPENNVKSTEEVMYGPEPLSEIFKESNVSVDSTTNNLCTDEIKGTNTYSSNNEPIISDEKGTNSNDIETKNIDEGKTPKPLLSAEDLLKIVKKTNELQTKPKLSTLKREELAKEFLKEEKTAAEMASSKKKKESKRACSSDRRSTRSPRKRSPEYYSNKSSKHEHRSSRHYDNRSSKQADHQSSRSRSKRSSEKSPSSRESESNINKAKLLEVAKKNALAMVANGLLPESISAEILRKERMVSNTSNKSVKEFTDFCRNLSLKEQTSESSQNTANTSEDAEHPFIHHPFKLKEVATIKLNIRNSIQIPTKSHAENVTENARTLSLQFPVSSGNQHRQKQLEWIPVEKDQAKQTTSTNTVQQSVVQKLIEVPKIPSPAPIPMLLPSAPPPESLLTTPFTYPVKTSTQQQQLVSGQQKVTECKQIIPSEQIIIPEVPAPTAISDCFPVCTGKMIKPADLQAVVVKHYQARIKLEQNPCDLKAMKDYNEANLQIQTWVQSKQVPGQFTGSTDVKLLSVQELSGPRPAWVKKDTFTRAAPVTEGKGMSLLKKMGWNPGEGLGKNKEGSLEPLLLDIKTDKKGLVSITESGKLSVISVNQNSCNKHPVSVLMEMCSKRKWLPPAYQIVKETGPPHKRLFIFKVSVNNKDYQPLISRMNKKQAKAEAAVVCLQALGVLPEEYNLP